MSPPKLSKYYVAATEKLENTNSGDYLIYILISNVL